MLNAHDKSSWVSRVRNTKVKYDNTDISIAGIFDITIDKVCYRTKLILLKYSMIIVS